MNDENHDQGNKILDSWFPDSNPSLSRSSIGLRQSQSWTAHGC